jgi:hypothetical protein
MHLGFGNLNGDGFGIGWFSPDERREVDPSPCVFTSITPAWCAPRPAGPGWAWLELGAAGTMGPGGWLARHAAHVAS